MKKVLKNVLLALFFVMALVLSLPMAIAANAEDVSTKGVDSKTETLPASYMGVNSNVNTIRATTVGALPCIGDVKVLVFYTDFLNGSTNWTRTKEEVEEFFFSEDGKKDPSLAYSNDDSLRSFYYRSSYGKVDITGTVYEYQTKHDTSYYTKTQMALDEIIEHYKVLINWEDYDTNGDGYVDGIYLIARNKHSWGGPNYVGNYANEVGNTKIAKACFLDSDDLSTAYHETCHMFGPADMYSNVGLNPGGIAAESIMDGGRGDLPSATKFILGWLDNVQFVDLSNTGNFDLRSYSKHSDALVVYPNGNADNRNWFFVEYITKEGNDITYHKESGIRVWKSQMYLDEDYNIVGSKNYTSGMPASPYNFLETVHPYGQENYYLEVGESLTPYSDPSTSYSDTFYYVGGAKFLKDLTFSGIEISFDSLETGVAKVSVSIAANPDADYQATGKLSIITPDTTSTFLDDVSKIHFATIACDTEVKLPTEVKIKSVDSKKEYDVEIALGKGDREALLYVDAETLVELKKQGEFQFSDFSLYTYLGTKVDFVGENQTLSFEKYPTPASVDTTKYATGFKMSQEYNMSAFALSDKEVLTIYSDDIAKQLYWGVLDLSKNTTSKTALELPFDANGVTSWPTNDKVNVWKDGEYYCVAINGYLCYYKNKTLVSSISVSGLTFVGSENNSFFLSKSTGTVYHATLQDGSAQLKTISLRYNINLKSTITNVYHFVENQYIITTQKNLVFIDLSKNISKQTDYAVPTGLSQYRLSVAYENGYYYVFASFADAIMYQYDTSFNLIYQKCLLKGIGESTWGPFELNVSLHEGQWVVFFSSVSNANSISYLTTFMATFSLDGKINNYWRYGDTTFRYVCTILPLSHGRYLGLEYSKFFYINGASDEHHYFEKYEALENNTHTAHCSCGLTIKQPCVASDWIVLQKHTCNKEGIQQKICLCCGEIVAYEVVPAHTPTDWIIEREATCYTEGLKYKICSVCEEEVERVIIPITHTPTDWIVEKEATCTEEGYKYKQCSICKEVVVEEKLEKLGHATLQHEGKEETCTEYGWNAYETCTRCNYTTYEEIPANGHTYGEWTQTLAPGYETKGEERRDCLNCDHYESKELAALGYLSAFIEAVEGLSKNAAPDVVYGEIYAALQLYEKLTEEEKAEAGEAFAVLQKAIKAYNEEATTANKDLSEATKIAFLPISASFVFLSAIFVLLKKKFIF